MRARAIFLTCPAHCDLKEKKNGDLSKLSQFLICSTALSEVAMHAAAAFEEETEFTKSPERASANRPGCSPGNWNAHINQSPERAQYLHDTAFRIVR